MKYLLPLFLLASPAAAKDYMLTVNDQERAALKEILDVAVKASGIQNAGITRNALYFLGKIEAAPEVVERKDDEPSKEPPK
jgi:hypothetical protein